MRVVFSDTQGDVASVSPAVTNLEGEAGQRAYEALTREAKLNARTGTYCAYLSEHGLIVYDRACWWTRGAAAASDDELGGEVCLPRETASRLEHSTLIDLIARLQRDVYRDQILEIRLPRMSRNLFEEGEIQRDFYRRLGPAASAANARLRIVHV